MRLKNYSFVSVYLYMKCSECKNNFIPSSSTIHCLRCNRWFCENCWIDFNDEGWPDTETHGNRFYKCPQGTHGEFLTSDCEPCEYGSDCEYRSDRD